MSDNRVLCALRMQAWERAKAELNSILCASYSDSGNGDDFSKVMHEFIEKVENEGLAE